MNFRQRGFEKIFLLLSLFIYPLWIIYHFLAFSLLNDDGSSWSLHSKWTYLSQYRGNGTETMEDEDIFSANEHLENIEVFPKVNDLYIFEPLNVTFIKELKNPCWFESKSLENYFTKHESTILRCLPAFLLVGMPKCGTTDLYNRIKLHPQVRAIKKGPHWWTRKRFSYETADSINESFSTYVDHFNEISQELQHSCLKSSPEMFESCKDTVTFDASPSTMWDNSAMQKYFESKITKSKSKQRKMLIESIPLQKYPLANVGANSLTKLKKGLNRSKRNPSKIEEKKYLKNIETVSEIENERKQNIKPNGRIKMQRVRKRESVESLFQIEDIKKIITPPMTISPVLPNTKIIILLRNPVDRLYSEFTYSNPKSPHQFDKMVNNSIDVWAKCRQMKSIKFCVYNQSRSTTGKFAKLNVGAYSVFLKDWMHQFPSKNILVIKTEQLSVNLEEEMMNIFNHLDLRPLSKKEFHQIIDLRKLNKNKYYKSVGPMLGRTRKKLQDFYRPFNIEIAKLLQDESFLSWL